MIGFDESELFLVTGASSGIGRATAIRLVGLGARVLGVGRNPGALEETAAACAGLKGAFIPEPRDLSQDTDALADWVKSLAKQHGPLRGAVLAAGQTRNLPLKLQRNWRTLELFSINVFANLAIARGFCSQGAYREDGASLVFVSSIAATRGVVGASDYSASKAALHGYVLSLAKEVASRKIRVNEILPGYVDTPMLRSENRLDMETFLKDMDEKSPLGLGKPEAIADPICFLLSDAARWMTGASVTVDGGGSLV